ncbi:MAG: glycosyltransferase [Pseudorhodobacter sp.]|nr:glycosyltransferase [Pseudorhodobacter sp.]
MNTIIHFTTVHARTDTRIRVKEVASLARHFDADVRLYVQDGLGDETDVAAKVRIHDTGARPGRRLARMTLGAWRMYRAVRAARPTIAHFHDPELIPVGLLLKLSGVKVIYDVHEDVPGQILSKFWIPAPMRRIVAFVAGLFESAAARFLDAIVLAEPVYEENFPKGLPHVVQNYPIISEFSAEPVAAYRNKPPHFCYVGGITELRGAVEMVDAIALMPQADVRLILGGAFSPADVENKMMASPGWSRTEHRGVLNRAGVVSVMNDCLGGLATLKPIPNYVKSYPTKLFEYMIAGIPSIASDFPFWRDILKGVDCAIFVDPLNPQAIADAMQWILDHPEEAEAMGRRGQVAVRERFNWEAEEKKLVALYRQLLNIEAPKAKEPAAT